MTTTSQEGAKLGEDRTFNIDFVGFFSNGYYRFPGPSGREDDVLVSGFLTTREQEPAEQINLLESLWPE